MAPRGRSAAETVRGTGRWCCVKRVSENGVEIAEYVVWVTISSRERDGSRARSAASRGPALGSVVPIVNGMRQLAASVSLSELLRLGCLSCFSCPLHARALRHVSKKKTNTKTNKQTPSTPPHTHKQTTKQTHKQASKQTKQTNTHTNTNIHKHIHTQTNAHTNTQTHKKTHANKQTPGDTEMPRTLDFGG